jgi:Lantibiotic dehydratase, N terminus
VVESPVARHDLDVERGETRSARPRAQVLATGDLVVERAGESLVVRTRDRRHAFDIIRFYEQHLIAESYARFGLVAPHPHIPRITIDDVVVQRESWTFEAASVAFAAEPGELARLVGARRFAAAHGMPRCVFVKTDTEAKPFFVDFESPIFVEIFARNLVRAKRARISEMLPALEQCWLVDARGNRYTSELRVVAIDERSNASAPR